MIILARSCARIRYVHQLQCPKFRSASSLRFVAVNKRWSYSLLLVAITATVLSPWKSSAILADEFVLDEPERVVSAQELGLHSSANSCWICIDGIVYDVTDFLENHPGGSLLISQNAGTDVTTLFNQLHPNGTLQKTVDQLKRVGVFDVTSAPAQSSSRVDASSGDRPKIMRDLHQITNVGQFEDIAKQVLGEDSVGWKYIYSGADTCFTQTENESAFKRLRFIPRVGRSVDPVDTSIDILGHQAPFPLFSAPHAGAGFTHPDGDFILTRLSARTGMPQVLSCVASKELPAVLAEKERLRESGQGEATVWWQLYMRKNRDINAAQLQHAGENVDVVFFTMDTIVVGKRELDSTGIATLAKTKKAQASAYSQSPADANLSFSDINFLRKHAPNCKFVAKGLASVEDVAIAKEMGFDGVVLSNHGGRQLDYAPASISTLARLRLERPDLLDDKSFQVFIDGGIRRGTDMLKAICLGASGCGTGRVFLYAQAAYGLEGVEKAYAILEQEFRTGMQLLGAKSISDLKPEMVEMLPGLVGEQFKGSAR